MDYNRLKEQYQREVSRNGQLSKRIYDLCGERDALKDQMQNYEQLRRAVGSERAETAVRQIRQEQAELEFRRSRRRVHSRDDRQCR